MITACYFKRRMQNRNNQKIAIIKINKIINTAALYNII